MQAWEMYKSKKLVDMVDPVLNLKGKVNEEEAVTFLKVALLCVQEKIGSRPKLSKALKMMTNEINISNVEITKPAIITDFMNVKTCNLRSHTSQTISTNASPQ
ncbi:hypothetical protein M5689_001640 [Euphorbia peplus]|nr:hypothetical protein M5689_001640 [Euphorbia peplus]